MIRGKLFPDRYLLPKTAYVLLISEAFVVLCRVGFLGVTSVSYIKNYIFDTIVFSLVSQDPCITSKYWYLKVIFPAPRL